MVTPRLGQQHLLIVAGSACMVAAVNDVVQQTIRRNQWTTVFAPAQTDPCLQIADYCTWAIQRKWESVNQRDDRSYKLIKDKIDYEFDFWEKGRTKYY